MSNSLSIFLSQAKNRSLENQKAFQLLVDSGLFGVAIGILRQELDTLIRLSYLYLDETAINTAHALIEKSINGLP